MATPAPLAVPPDVPRRIDPDDELRDRPSALIKMELEARRDDIKHHLEGLKNEFSSTRGVAVAGRPMPEAVAKKAVLIAGGVLATTLVLGLASGVRKKRRAASRVSDVDLVRAHAATLIDEAAARVARGADSRDAIRKTFRAYPVLLADAQSPAEKAGPGYVKLALNTLVGVGLKYAADRLTQKLTGHEETVEALADAAD